MKRFLRYVFYRELYRQLRNLGNDDDSEPTQSQESTRADQGNQQPQSLPIEEGPIESSAQLKQALQKMDPYDFEYFIADLWEAMGWDTEVSSAAQDRGVDVIATKSIPYEQTTLIQAKRYGSNTTVGSPEIQQYASLEDQYAGVDKVAVVTTNEFTNQARELADRLNVKLINGNDLVGLIERYEAVELVAQYLEFVQLVEEQNDVEEEVASQSRNSTVTEEGQAQRELADTTDTVLWQGVIGAATLGWLLSVVLINILPETADGVLILGSWILLPVGIYKDSQQIAGDTEWPQYRWAYILSSLVWIVAVIPGVIYLWRRYNLSNNG